MTCVNWLLTVASVVIFAVAVWPGYGGAAATQWIVGIAALVILIAAWTGVECKPCMNRKKKGKRK